MGFFDAFRSKKKSVPATRKEVPLEEQLRTLAALGIRPKHNDFFEWAVGEWGLKALETDPYGLLLHSLGSERERGSGEWEANSDNVYAFDAECVEGDDTYQKAFTRLSVLSNGSLSEITGSVDRKKGRASVSFSFNRRRYDWELEYDHDWFDIRSMDRVNELLRRSGSAKLFHASSSGQEVVIVFADPKTVERLNGLVAVPFLPEIF